MSAKFDFSPLRRFGIGFDHVFDLLDSISRSEVVEGFPPYNVEKTSDNSYRITIAVAGFDRDEISITTEESTLIVSGKKSADLDGQYLYRGFGVETFDREFQLADYVKVTAANLRDGLLYIDLTREVPEAMQPRRIDITTQTQPKLARKKSASTSALKTEVPRLASRLLNAGKKELRRAAATIAVTLLTCSAAVGQSSSVTSDLDLVAVPSDTAGTVQGKLQKAGYTDIHDLKKDGDGGWHASAKKDGKEVAVYLSDVSRLGSFGTK